MDVVGRKGESRQKGMLEMQLHGGLFLDFGRAKLHLDERNLNQCNLSVYGGHHILNIGVVILA